MASSGTSRIRSVNRDVANSDNEFVLEIATAATGDGPLVVHWDIGLSASYMPGAAESPSDMAIGLALAINTAYSTWYTATENGATITMTRVNGGPLYPTFAMSADSSATITYTGKHANERVLSDAIALGAGAPVGSNSGYGVSPSLEVDDRTKTVTVKVALSNPSGGAKTARWRLWWYTDGIGWSVDQEVNSRTISDPGTSVPSITSDTISVTSIGASRVACELIDDGAAGGLVSCTLDAWIVVSH